MARVIRAEASGGVTRDQRSGLVLLSSALMRLASIILLVSLAACTGEPSAPAPPAPEVVAPDAHPTDPPDTGVSDPGTAPDPGPEPDVPPTPDLPPACECSPAQHCDDGVCRPNVCLPAQVTCDSLAARRVCADDGSAATIEPCPDDTICYVGECRATVCSPDDPPFCDEGRRMVCNGLGTEVVPLPCPGGQGCQDGACVTVRPNVILVVDTSGSMSLLSGAGETYPEACEGPDCPPWTFPECDDPADPKTRIGRTKQALQQLIQSEAAASVRLALQRFPQSGSSYANCKHGHYLGQALMTGDQSLHEVDLGWFEPGLGQIMAVPFSPDTAENDVGRLLSWVDFTESITPSPGAPTCVHAFNCDTNLCVGGLCHQHDDPELRGIGATPLGRSLFYAGEYLRHFVLIEGRPCENDGDCPSPHHTCHEGACHDPLRHCRQTSIILFTDGEETVNADPFDFFNPIVQAKRLRYGLGCTAGVQCSSGATCQAGLCTPPAGAEPEPICKGTSIPCADVGSCPDYYCGSPDPCPGECETFSQPFKDPEGKNYVKGYDERPRSVTIHVVDASGFTLTNKLIAAWGGGAHVPVDFDDVDTIADQLLLLLDPKEAPSCAP